MFMTARAAGGPSIGRGAGFTIIEFMIAMTLSLLVLAALTGAFVASSRSRSEIERANQQMENGRFALQILTDDLQLAGYLSHLNLVSADAGINLDPPTGKPNPCSTTVGAEGSTSPTEIAGALLMHIQGYDNLAALGSELDDCLTDHKSGTDIVVVRRSATCIAASANCAVTVGAPYFQASLCAGPNELADADNDARKFFRLEIATQATEPINNNLDRTQRNCSTRADKRQYLTHIYFVANNDQAGDGIPTLKRAELGANSAGTAPAFSIVPLAHGIEDLQVEYGIDTDNATGMVGEGDGSPNVFTASPDRYPAAADCAANAACIRNWRNVMAMRLNVLARNTTASRDHVDSKVYTLGLDFAGGNQCARDANNDDTCEAFNDSFKRHVYQTSVRLNNPSGRRE